MVRHCALFAVASIVARRRRPSLHDVCLFSFRQPVSTAKHGPPVSADRQTQARCLNLMPVPRTEIQARLQLRSRTRSFIAAIVAAAVRPSDGGAVQLKVKRRSHRVQLIATYRHYKSFFNTAFPSQNVSLIACPDALNKATLLCIQTKPRPD